MDDRTDRLSIKEYAVLDTKSRRRDFYPTVDRDYTLIYEVSFDGDMIRAAVKEGRKALISALRTEYFFPVSSCATMIANGVTGLLDGDTELGSNILFDDRAQIEGYNEE